MKKTYLTIACMVFITHLAKAQWTTNGNDIVNSNSGNVGIGTSNLTAKFTIFQNAQLGSSAGNYLILSATGGLTGNNFRNNVWLVRTVSGTMWTTTRLHDGISVDNVYSTPQVDTKTWWERDAFNDIQSWGNSASTYLTINRGKVGIGTSVPSTDLHISEVSDSRPGGITAPSATVLKLSRKGSPSYSYNESAEFRIGHGGPDVWGSKMELFVNGASNVSDQPDQQVMTWQYNGNVGVGTTTPLARLQVFGTVLTGGGALNSNVDPIKPAGQLSYLANTGQMLIGWNRNAGAGETDFIANQGEGNIGGFAFYNHDNSNAENQLMFIQGNGNVSIGTPDAKGYKLAVNGSTIATSVTVKQNGAWPDYVFRKKYVLASLSEVKKFIEEHQHLPEIPSEQDIVENGQNLGELNKLLLKKVEELTLYLIEKDEHEKQQQKQLDALTKRIQLLESSK